MIAPPRRYLLDVNLVLALLDPQHVFHDAAHDWIARQVDPELLTCPLVQNGVLRVAANAAYPGRVGTVSDVRRVLAAFCAEPRHRFVPDDVSLLDDDRLTDHTLLTPARITDVYLLALAVAHDAQLATFDRKILAEAVRGGRRALEVLGREWVGIAAQRSDAVTGSTVADGSSPVRLFAYSAIRPKPIRLFVKHASFGGREHQSCTVARYDSDQEPVQVRCPWRSANLI